MKNALSVDLEDWFCAYNLEIPISEWDKQELRVVENTRRILNILRANNAKATFFVLGWIGERVPFLLNEIESQGHEIATHGYSHTLITSSTPEFFEEDLTRAIEVTKKNINSPIIGFRAPSFTITSETLWAIDILAKQGIKYDSSIFPTSFHPDYGISHAPLTIHKRGELLEVPLSCVEVLGNRIPCSGGGYFRFYPYKFTRALLKKCNKDGRPVIFYIHPWEIDPGQPRRKLSPIKSFRHYINLDKTEDRLKKLLSDFEFTTIKEVSGL